MKVAITGAGGRLGKALFQVLTGSAAQVVAWDRSALDVTDASAVNVAVQTASADWVVNCAAWTSVDRCEDDPVGAMAVNAEAVAALARACGSAGTRLCHVSTDYVFDGNKGAPYLETDATAPINAYGRAKLQGEEAAARLPAALIARVSLVYGDGDRPSFVEKAFAAARDGTPFTAVSDMAGSPSFAPELAAALRQLLRRGAEGIWHLGGAGGCTRLELARFAARLIRPGAEQEINAADQATLGLRAPRPIDSTLDVTKLATDGGVQLQPWQQTLSAWARKWLAR